MFRESQAFKVWRPETVRKMLDSFAELIVNDATYTGGPLRVSRGVILIEHREENL